MPSKHPFTDQEFEAWLSLSLDRIYDDKAVRSARRLFTFSKGPAIELAIEQQVNPDFEEMQYAAAVLRLLWRRQYSDFHIRSLRREGYQETYLGLTAGEISNVIAKAVISCNGLNRESINVILEEKKNVIRGSGSLTYVHPEPAANLGGYKALRSILERAAYTFSPRAKARHVEPCKGILLVGLPGCGKDLCKRVASSITNRALLDLDFGSIMGEGGGVIGSSAMSIKRALSIAGTIKGILGISEFEKAVSGMKSSNKTDGGETARTISYLLNWMQDNQDVLVFATANDVRELESEQFRIGRFSYIHFVDLPETEDRKDIFRVHLKKRALEVEQFDLEKLVEKSTDFSGAEIEGAVKDGVLEAFIDGDRQAETRDIIKAIESITPTAQMMSEKIEEIRKWARNNIKGAAGRIDNSGISGNRSDRIYEL